MAVRKSKAVLGVLIVLAAAAVGVEVAKAERIVAKFAPERQYFDGVSHVASTERATFGIRTPSPKRLRIVRAGGGGRPRTIVRTSLIEDAIPIAWWATAERGAIGQIAEIEELNESGDPAVYRQRLYVITDSGRFTRIAGTPDGALAARGNLVTAIRWLPNSRTSFVVYDVSRRIPKRVGAGTIPGQAAKIKPPPRFWGGSQIAVDILGDRIAIAQPGSVTVFNWRTRAILESFPIADGTPVELAMSPSTLVVAFDSVIVDGKHAPSVIAYSRPTGAVRWSNDPPRGGYESAIDGSMRFAAWANERVQPIIEFASDTGAASEIGHVPIYHPSDMGNLMFTGGSMNARSYTWTESDCYWTNILIKPISEPVTRSRKDCDFSYVRNSMRLSGRTLSLRIRSVNGMRATTVELRPGSESVMDDVVAVPPGFQRMSLTLSRASAAQIRRNTNDPISLTFGVWGQPERTISDRVRVD